MRVLIIDDDLTSRRLFAKHLEPYGYCDLASSGEEGIIKVHSSLKRAEPYELICLDIAMPDLDGHEVLAQIRRIESGQGVKPGDRVKIVIATALEKRHLIRAVTGYIDGCNGYLLKPIKRETMLGKVMELGLI